MGIPNELVRAVREHKIVPFVGAGVSVGVKPELFPTWAQLLQRTAGELEKEDRAADAEKVRHLMASEDFLGAAEWGVKQLGPYRFHRFLRSVFRQRRPADLDTSVVEGIWALRPSLVVTTNYDDVLRWAGPPDVQMIANDQPEELAFLQESSSEWPAVWHLHGTIQRLSTLILGGTDYKELYGSEKERATRYERAIFELNSQLASRPFLYIGFSLSDPYVLQQIADVLRLSKAKNAPSYALMKQGDADAGGLWSNYNIQLVEYEEHGRPLAELLQLLAHLAFEPVSSRRGKRNSRRPDGPPEPPAERVAVPRPSLEDDLAQTLSQTRRLLVLAPRRGGARTLARSIADRHFGKRVTWLMPPNVPSCTQAEYFAALAGNRSIDSFLKLESWLYDRARRQGGDHLILVRHDGGPIEHLISLGNALRRLIEHPRNDRGSTKFFVLVAGESPCAWLRFNTPSFSLFSGAPVRYVPPLSADEVGQAMTLWAAGTATHIGSLDRADDVCRATGGHPGLVEEALSGGGSLDFDSLTARLSKSPAVRGVLRMRLSEDDRRDLPARRHARTVLKDLLAGRPVRKLDEIEDELSYPEVRLYYDGLVVSHPNAELATALRCEAVRIAAEQVFALEQSAPHPS